MQVANPKSFVAGLIALLMFALTLFMGTRSHAEALHNFNLVLFPAVSAFCFWHAFEGRRPLLGRSELHTSMFLGVLSLLIAVGHAFLSVRYSHKTFSILTATLFFAGAVFYFREAIREKRSNPA
jgi:hypothetical protein